MFNTKKFYSHKPLMSIITVVFNGEKFLEQTIQSVINQTYKNIEYIIIDGGSTDGTLDIIKKYKDKIDYWASEKDEGIYDAMNKGIKVAKGKYLAFINADDWYEDNALNHVFSAYSQNQNIDFFYGNLNFIKDGGEVVLWKGNKGFKGDYVFRYGSYIFGIVGHIPLSSIDLIRMCARTYTKV